MNLNHDDIATLANVIAKEVGAVISAQSNSSRWLSLREAMEYAKVKSVNTIKNWINEGYIYGFRRSGEWIIDRESIDDWYESEKY